jgi:hypothetical protein
VLSASHAAARRCPGFGVAFDVAVSFFASAFAGKQELANKDAGWQCHIGSYQIKMPDGNAIVMAPAKSLIKTTDEQ